MRKAATLAVALVLLSPGWAGAQTLDDLHSADILIEHALAVDVDQAIDVLQDRAEARAARRAVERNRERLLHEEVRLAAIRVALETKLAQAEAIARAAGLRVEQLERQEQRLRAAARRQKARQDQTLPGGLGGR